MEDKVMVLSIEKGKVQRALLYTKALRKHVICGDWKPTKSKALQSLLVKVQETQADLTEGAATIQQAINKLEGGRND